MGSDPGLQEQRPCWEFGNDVQKLKLLFNSDHKIILKPCDIDVKYVYM